jgi:tetratricopeptide (TPR) repeat protein
MVHGQTLKQLQASSSPPDVQKSLDIVSQIAQAMQVAHDSGLVHSDLKPSNLMIEPSGAVRILDFGLAAHNDEHATTSVLQTDPQGTIVYMPPERMLGAPLKRQCDIYALGVILYELLHGVRPFSNLNGLALAAASMQTSSASWFYHESLHPSMIALIRAMTAHVCEQRIHSMHMVVEKIKMLSVETRPLTSVTSIPILSKVKSRWFGGANWLVAKKRYVLFVAMLLLSGVALYLIPHMTYLMQMQLTPFSEAIEMQQGMAELKLADRPSSLNEAEKHFSTILQHTPKNSAAVAGLAMIYSIRFASDSRDEVWLQKAAAGAQQALQLNEQLALAHVAYARVLELQGDSVAALKSCERALTLDPENIFALNAKLESLRSLRRFDEAKKIAEESLQHHPQEYVFANQLGAIEYQQHHYDAAEKAFRHSIKLQPDSVYSYANLSAVLLNQNRNDEAMQVLQQGLQIRPSAWLYGNLGNALFLRGEYVEAAAAFEAAVSPTKGNPSDYLGWANLADTLLWIPGRQAEAVDAYKRANQLLAPQLERKPNDVTLISRMGLYLAHAGEKKQSEALLTRAIQLAPNNATVCFRVGLGFELIGQRNHAIDEIIQAIKLGYSVKFIDSEPAFVGLRRDPNYLQHRETAEN